MAPRSDRRGAADGARVEAEVTHRLGSFSLRLPRPRDRDRRQGRIHRLAAEAAMIRITISPAAFDAICATLPVGSVAVEAHPGVGAGRVRLLGAAQRNWGAEGRSGPARATVLRPEKKSQGTSILDQSEGG